MSFDESPDAGAAGHCLAEVSPPWASGDRPVRSAAVLSWTRLPTLAPDACTEVERSFAECEHRYDATERRVYAVWLRHLLNLGFLSGQELCEAMASARPYLALHTLQIRAGQRLNAHLERIIAEQSLGQSVHWQPNLTIDLMNASECKDALLLISLGCPYVFDVKSLNSVPLRLARMVYESLQLLNYALQPSLLPHELWREEATFVIDLGEEAFAAINKAGGLRNLKAAIRCIQRKKLTDYFSTEPESLRRELRYFRDVLYMRPPWMRGRDYKRPIASARRLLKRIAQYEIERGTHPWLDYARHVCQSILARFRDEKDLKRIVRRVFRHYEREFEGGVPLHQSLVLSSASEIEKRHLDDLAQRMMDTGENSVERFYLTKMASSTLRYIVELRATGIGLLARADGVNEQVRRGRYARTPT
jgi:hypothetical protein